MMTTTQRDAGLSLALAFLFLALCVGAAEWTAGESLFSLSPPGGGPADMAESLRQDLHLTFFTIWAALLLATPALALLPSARRSINAWRWWRITWSASLLVFAVHFYWAVVIVFDNDWSRILNTPRVTVPRLDTVFAVWWAIDVCLAWAWRPMAYWVYIQRWALHLLAFVLFFVGAAREGELPVSRALGWAMAVGVVAGLLSRLFSPKTPGHPSPGMDGHRPRALQE